MRKYSIVIAQNDLVFAFGRADSREYDYTLSFLAHFAIVASSVSCNDETAATLALPSVYVECEAVMDGDSQSSSGINRLKHYLR